MNFGQRLKRYLIGVLLGLIFVIAFFNERWGLMKSWLPGQRVLDRMEATYIGNAELANCHLTCFHLDSIDVRSAIKEGDVNFKKSLTRSTPLIYVVENNSYEFIFSANDSTSVLEKINSATSNNCDCH